MKRTIYMLTILFIIAVGAVCTHAYWRNDAAQLCSDIREGNNSSAMETAGRMNNLNVTSFPFPELMHFIDAEVTTPLVCACECGNAEMIEYLLGRGASPMYAPADIAYPLEAFCSTGTGAGYDSLVLLLDNGADPGVYKYRSPFSRLVETLPHRTEETYMEGIRMILKLVCYKIVCACNSNRNAMW